MPVKGLIENKHQLINQSIDRSLITDNWAVVNEAQKKIEAKKVMFWSLLKDFWL